MNPIYIDNKEYGTVTSGTYAPYLKKAIGMTYLPVERTEIGTKFQIQIRNNKVLAKVVETPFYKRDK
jgi:aminomethyltransferase